MESCGQHCVERRLTRLTTIINDCFCDHYLSHSARSRAGTVLLMSRQSISKRSMKKLMAFDSESEDSVECVSDGDDQEEKEAVKAPEMDTRLAQQPFSSDAKENTPVSSPPSLAPAAKKIKMSSITSNLTNTPAPFLGKSAKPKKASTSSAPRISYKGFRFPVSGSANLSRVPFDSLTPETFFEKYVSPRRPVIVTGLLSASDFERISLWRNDEYLHKRAGNCTLQVERRASVGTTYGHGVPRVPLTFSSLLSSISPAADKSTFAVDKTDSALYYLTSQTEDYEGSDLPAVVAPPLTHLRPDFPLRPSLFGQLCPYQLNLWAGQSKDGASSGLHHDFHDNMYILVRGYKRFNIFAPSDAPYIYTRGKVQHVLSNGFMEYSHFPPTRADGVPLEIAVGFLQDKQAELERKIENTTTPATKKKLENELEKVCDELVDYDMKLIAHKMKVKTKTKSKAKATQETEQEKKAREEDETFAHFSKIPLPDLYAKDPVNQHWCATKGVQPHAVDSNMPLFRHATKCSVYLSPGESLFLPAGWFHEVTSFNTFPPDAVIGDIGVETTKADGAVGTRDSTKDVFGGGHMALNYWFHPPDNLSSFKKPYKSSFWEDNWAKHQSEEEKLHSKAQVERVKG